MTIAVGNSAPARRASLWDLVKEGFNCFIEDHALTRGAAIAFYAVTAIAPVLFITTAVAGAFLGTSAASAAMRYQLRQVMSPQGAEMVQFAITHVAGSHHSLLGSLLGFLALIFTASGVFTEIEDALNVVWKAPRTQSYFYQIVRGRVMSLILVICLGILLMVSMIIAGGIGVLGRLLNRDAGLGHVLVGLINFGLSFGLVSILFAALYKVLPNKNLAWRDVIVGAFVTAVLFEAGQALIGLYLSRVIYANVYGAAAGVIVLLVWVYYAAQIFLFGAEFTRAWARHYGTQQGVEDPKSCSTQFD
ncbi:MAG TPA: YihY/virulence factor BrkB family protein [Rhizomicrobium sp.]|nr:YihY/virulence factor BrkB family protein [Rhizomicrobium sp.]